MLMSLSCFFVNFLFSIYCGGKSWFWSSLCISYRVVIFYTSNCVAFVYRRRASWEHRTTLWTPVATSGWTCVQTLCSVSTDNSPALAGHRRLQHSRTAAAGTSPGILRSTSTTSRCRAYSRHWTTLLVHIQHAESLHLAQIQNDWSWRWRRRYSRRNAVNKFWISFLISVLPTGWWRDRQF